MAEQKPKGFRVTADHLKLLRAAYWYWDDGETGAPAIHSKRPYGNSFVAADVAEILDWEVDPDDGLTREQEDRALTLHGETLWAVQEIIARASPTGEQPNG